MPSAVALIPARAGSQRVPGKNIRPLAGHPLISYTVAAAHSSGLFEAVVVSTDSPEIAEVAARYGAEAPGLRPSDLAGATSPDIEWVRHMLELLKANGKQYDLFALLRPTSPFRSAETIKRAWNELLAAGDTADSIRAVELCRQHPGKMWVIPDDGSGVMRPLLQQPEAGVPYHSRQYQALPKVYVQNSSLEIAWSRVVFDGNGSIAGERVLSFLTDELEGFTIDYPDDWERAELLAREHALPEAKPLPAGPNS